MIIFTRISSPINGVLLRLSSLEREINSSIEEKKQRILKEFILEQKELEYHNLSIFLKTFNMEISMNGNFVLLYIIIDHYDEFCSEYNTKDRELFKFAIINVASELCTKHFKNEGLDLGNDHLVIILNILEKDEETYIETLEPLINKIQDSIMTCIKISVSIVVSTITDSFHDIPYLYSQARELSFDRFFFGHKCILFSDGVKKKMYSDYKYPMDLEKKLIDSLFKGNIDEAEIIYRNIIDDSLECSYYTIKLTLSRLAQAICSALYTIERNMLMSFNFSFENFLYELEKKELLDEVNNHFKYLFQLIAKTLDNKREMRHQDLLEHIERIVNSKYSDSSLSVEVVAEQLNISPAYLGRLYIKYRSKSIIDYINEVRILKAKELLICSNKAISEIFEMVGYNSVQTFYRVFKKIMGITPNEYRNNQRNNLW